jgi:hypothetical protein
MKKKKILGLRCVKGNTFGVAFEGSLWDRSERFVG